MSICTLIIAGNLGSNAESKVISGKRYTKCSVAVSTTNNQTQWIEVLKKDEEQKLVPFLTKGSKITAIGIPTFSAYVANKNGEPQPSITLWASNIELPGKGSSDSYKPLPDSFQSPSKPLPNSSDIGAKVVEKLFHEHPAADNTSDHIDDLPF